MIRNLVLRGFSLLLVLALLQLAYACFRVSSLDSPFNDAHTLSLVWNPFLDSSAKSYHELQASVVESRRRLEFMTFTQERRREASRILDSLKEQMNLYPFNVKHWAEVVELQAELGLSDPSEQLWSMESALKLGGWNHQYRSAISVRCLDESYVLFKLGGQLCRTLLSNMPYSKLQRNAHAMGVDQKYLKARLVEIEQKYGPLLTNEQSK